MSPKAIVTAAPLQVFSKAHKILPSIWWTLRDRLVPARLGTQDPDPPYPYTQLQAIVLRTQSIISQKLAMDLSQRMRGLEPRPEDKKGPNPPAPPPNTM